MEMNPPDYTNGETKTRFMMDIKGRLIGPAKSSI